MSRENQNVSNYAHGMNRESGQVLDNDDHIAQSITDILTTSKGERVMRRDYGSLLPRLVDMPMNDYVIQQIYAESVIALITWEPRINIQRVNYTIVEGKFALIIEYYNKLTDRIRTVTTGALR